MSKFFILPFLIWMAFCSVGFCQKEANNWCFGDHTGLNFSTSPPRTIYSEVNTIEGIASISDKNGALLFYTDGMTLYSKDHSVMQNGTGLLGRTSSTQSSLIVPKPGTTNIYYVFTADATANTYGYHGELGYNYSIVDINQNNGLGTVVSKNNLLYAPSSEKLAATKHKNGVDYWIMTHSQSGDAFTAYLLDCNGISASIISSNAGPNLIDTYIPPAAIGYMKFSPDASMLGFVTLGMTEAAVLRFDNETGTVQNGIDILSYWSPFHYLFPDGTAFDLEDVYGIEFSPNNKLLYLTCIDGPQICQFDLSVFTSVAVTTSLKVIGGGRLGAIQLGPDQKIYITEEGYSTLQVITKPNIYGSGCMLSNGPQLPNFSHYGLPNFVSNFLDTTSEINISTSGCKVTFSLKHNYPSSTYKWDFGDPYASIDTSNLSSTEYEYPRRDTYLVNATVTTSEGCTAVYQLQVTVDCPENLFIPTLITPNEDHLNDSFQIVGLNLFPDNTLSIYNRWGDLVYQKSGYDNSWDGVNCSDGVYYYLLTSPDFKSEKKGMISIIR
jgi:gliding motility-associated-like protein